MDLSVGKVGKELRKYMNPKLATNFYTQLFEIQNFFSEKKEMMKRWNAEATPLGHQKLELDKVDEDLSKIREKLKEISLSLKKMMNTSKYGKALDIVTNL